jgi:hypothetical protein
MTNAAIKSMFAISLILLPWWLFERRLAHSVGHLPVSGDLMDTTGDQIISAQVVLRSATGKSPDGDSVITTETIRDFLPSAEAVARATEAFAALGFDVGIVQANSFSISAPVGTFERVFKVHLRRQEGGSAEAVQADGSGSYELPLEALPKPLTDLTVVVTFTPPPDFGPTKFGP